MMAGACLAFLWKGDPPDVDYDPNNMVDGFLEGFTRTCGYLVITPSLMLLTVFQMIRHILLGLRLLMVGIHTEHDHAVQYCTI
jgi:hypothetical protein